MNINNMVAQTGADSATMGHLFWYAISKMTIEDAVLFEQMEKLNLADYKPRQISAIDAFRRSSSMAEEKNVETSDPRIVLNYLVKEVYSDKDEIIRKIVKETVNKDSKNLKYETEALSIRFDKERNEVSIYQSDGSQWANEKFEDIRKDYEFSKSHYNDRHLREIVSNILRDMSPIAVKRSGGIYFTLSKHYPKLQALTTLTRGWEDSQAYNIPVMDTSDHKDMVRQNLFDSLKSHINDFKTVLGNDNLGRKAVKTKLEELRRLVTGYSEYKKIIDTDIEKLDDMLFILRSQAATMLDKMQG